ncbi:FAD/NAD-P-binding domain-containing protein [Cristinia sonorae]|uniref:FAD/NAD-P-binding domain-containing protein n=1 Tax=Cristinia sonorae TaxID=1940300 RepID=A0A8K0XTF0_9AGAR|nr:FAD/NAD-P-binding domain-containing protein [Cristinia sonorae]
MAAKVAPESVANAEGISKSLNLYNGRKAALPLHIIIVGSGIGGLAAAHCLTQAGHKVTMFESASFVGEVGAGIQVSPNITRLLVRWGLEEPLKNIAVRPEAVVFRRYNTGERVGYTRWGDQMDKYGAPYYHIHRADFHKLLYDLALPNITLHLKSAVVGVDPEAPSVTLQSGEVVKGDLVIGADGVKSFVQQVVIGRVNPAQPTGDAAYRALIPTSYMLADPELKPFVDTPEMSAWMAPGRHLMAYSIRGKREYNLVMLRPDDSDSGSVESWTAEGNAAKMRAEFADFEPRVQKMLSQVKSTLSWRLMDRQPLETWVHASGKVALLGDACHPMLPYRAQGAAMAIEDAAVLGNLFSHLSHPSQILPLLKAYQDLRLPRASATQAQSRLNQKIFHLPDGPEQEARDADMRKAMEMELRLLRGEQAEDVTLGNPNQWGDKTKSEIQYGYDADKAAEDWWEETGKFTVAPLAQTQAESRL